MPDKRRHRHRRRTMRGGFLDTLSSWGASLTQGANSLWEKTKQASSTPTYTAPPAPAYTAPSMPSSAPSSMPSYGGKTRKRRMRGGFTDNTPATGLAAHAGSFSGETARPHNWVGGKTKRRKARKTKRRR